MQYVHCICNSTHNSRLRTQCPQTTSQQTSPQSLNYWVQPPKLRSMRKIFEIVNVWPFQVKMFLPWLFWELTNILFILIISLTSSNNQFSEFRIFCLFTFLLIFLWNTFFWGTFREGYRWRCWLLVLLLIKQKIR